MSEFRIVERDKKIIKEIDRWKIIQGRHIRELAGFNGQRACDTRLRKLINAGYIKREKILYGVAGIYSNQFKATRIVAGISGKKRMIRLDHIMHDIAVVDTAIYFNKEHDVRFEDIKTEIELHRQDGFGVRKRRPDLVFTKNGKTICVEIELSLKAKSKYDDIVSNNFRDYDRQIWVVPNLTCKIAKVLEQRKTEYPNVELLELSEIQKVEGE